MILINNYMTTGIFKKKIIVYTIENNYSCVIHKKRFATKVSKIDSVV